MKGTVVAVIPARMGSTRFSGKVLFPYQGKPLIYHVWNQVRKAGQIDRVIVATDSPEVVEASEAFGAEVVVTSDKHRTGTDRAAEAVGGIKADIVLNVQADNFGLKPALLSRVVKQMKSDPGIEFATLARRIDNDADLFDSGVVKVIKASDGRALWFSRFPLPYLQKATGGTRCRQYKFLSHIGVYFFRQRGLKAFAGWKRGPLEQAESLEQLRILENGGSMQVIETNLRTVSIDRPEDVKKIASLHT